MKKVSLIIISIMLIVSLVGNIVLYKKVKELNPIPLKTIEDLKQYYDSNNMEDIQIKDIMIRVPDEVGEFLESQGKLFKEITISDSGFVHIEDKDLMNHLKTPYEHYHLEFGYTENNIPILYKINEETIITTKRSRLPENNDIMHDYLEEKDNFILITGKASKIDVTLKYIGEREDGSLNDCLVNGEKIKIIIVECTSIYNE